MTTTRIQSGVYKHINADGESWIIRGGQYWDAGQTYWISNQCNSLDECHNDNSSCMNFLSKKHAIEWLND